jgi:hypothetical protein
MKLAPGVKLTLGMKLVPKGDCPLLALLVLMKNRVCSSPGFSPREEHIFEKIGLRSLEK